MLRKYSTYLLLAAAALIIGAAVAGCSSTKHVPQGEYLLDNVDIKVLDNKDVKSADLFYYLRQVPNHEVLGFAKLQLATYSLSGKDTTRWYNRWLRKLGQPPVIYDSTLVTASADQLERALANQGYLDARVTFDTIGRPDKKRMDVKFYVTTGAPRTIGSINYEIHDSAIDSIIAADPRLKTLRTGDRFDRAELDDMRAGIARHLQQCGYYTFTKDNITFYADTAAGSQVIDLTLVVHQPRRNINVAPLPEPDVPDTLYHTYRFGKVTYITDFDARSADAVERISQLDSVDYKGITILYGPDHYLNAKTLYDNCYITPGELYTTTAINRTYEALGRLGILKYVNIQLEPRRDADGNDILDTYILLDRTRKQGVTLELEGTNSEGDLGFGVGVTYQHRNLAHGSQLLTAKLRTSYESLSGNFDGLLNDRYTEYAAEVGLTIPKFEAPFLSRDFKRRVRASTEFDVSFNYQERPEYTRIIAGGAWKYNWNNRNNTIRRTLDLIDVNYVYLPHSTINFIDEIAPTNPLLRYSYEDHFIMRTGYTYRRTNRRIAGAMENAWRQPSVYSLRASVEFAGNLLYALSKISGQEKSNDAYKIFGIQYAQYVKGEFDYSWTRHLDLRNCFALHVGMGIGVPYGNSSMIPFEKRFYAGGANGVRGWGVRALGPGGYDARNSATDFINQCGDIRLDLSAEYRAKLFWVFEGALFVDAGNIWTIRNYENQPNGLFKFDEFYKQIAAAYGVGLRMDFTYFLLRFDLGMKAHNPALGQEPWPLIHPNWHRDATFHFAVGYPF